MDTLIPESPRWEEFIEQLNAALAENGCAGDASDDTHCHAKAVMRDMDGLITPTKSGPRKGLGDVARILN